MQDQEGIGDDTVREEAGRQKSYDYLQTPQGLSKQGK